MKNNSEFINIDKVSNLDILDSFSLEEEMGRDLF